jgi:hypothetical protein
MRGRHLLPIAVAAIAVLAVPIVAATFLSANDGLREGEPSTPLIIEDKDGVVLEDLTLSSATGGCVVVKNSRNVTIRNSDIGPCAGNAIEIRGSSDVRIVDSYIHPEFTVTECCDNGDAVFVLLSSNILIQGNIIAYGESNVEMLGVQHAQVIGNFLLNPLGPFPRGQQVQVWSRGDTRSSDILIEANYTLASQDASYRFPDGQWDAINLGQTDRAVVKDNYVVGGTSHSGCGLIADASANEMQFLNNTLVRTGQCGIGIASGTNQIVDGNRIFNDGLSHDDAGNTALYVWNQYKSPCGPVRLSNNVAVLRRPDGSLSSYWRGGGCDPVTSVNNVFNEAAVNDLSPIDSKYPPPAIPPRSFERPPPARSSHSP